MFGMWRKRLGCESRNTLAQILLPLFIIWVSSCVNMGILKCATCRAVIVTNCCHICLLGFVMTSLVWKVMFHCTESGTSVCIIKYNQFTHINVCNWKTLLKTSTGFIFLYCERKKNPKSLTFLQLTILLYMQLLEFNSQNYRWSFTDPLHSISVSSVLVTSSFWF